MDNISSLVRETGAILLQQGITMATAESCTGGWIAQQATAIAGSSDWFECGFISYSNLAKQRMLGVCQETLATHGAVSEQVVAEMVSGALAGSKAMVAVAVSGVAGPGGASKEKPVGTVCIAWGRRDGQLLSRCYHFQGDREQVRWQTVVTAFQGLLELLKISAGDSGISME